MKVTREVEGGRYKHKDTGEIVTAVHWQRDGDHPDVERYPIDGREYKGILVLGPKDRIALRYGDWICQDAKGRTFVVDGRHRHVEDLIETTPKSGLFRKERRELPSLFDEQYLKEEDEMQTAGVLAMLAVALIASFFAETADVLILGLGVTHLMYYTPLLAQWNGSANIFDLDEAADDIKLSAHTNTYAPNQDTHDFFDDLTNEVTGTNYTAGGAALGSQTLTRSTNTVTFDAADVVWTQSGAGFSNARKFVLYRNTGVTTTSRLFSVVTADADVGNVTGDLTIAWNASGIATWSTT